MQMRGMQLSGRAAGEAAGIESGARTRAGGGVRFAALCGMVIGSAIAAPVLAEDGAAAEEAVSGGEAGFYIGTDIGISFVSNVSIKDFTPAPGSLEFGVSGVEVDIDPGVAWNIDLGYRFNEHFALEVESGYYRNGFGGFTAGEFVTGVGASTAVIGGDGNFSQIPLFLNGKFDIPLVKREAGSSGALNLQLGGGVGVVRVEADISDIQALGLPGVSAAIDGGSWEFGGQFMVGLGWEVTPSIQLGLEYRLMAVSGANFGNASFSDPLLQPIATVESDSILTQAIQARVSFRF